MYNKGKKERSGKKARKYLFSSYSGYIRVSKQHRPRACGNKVIRKLSSTKDR
jgi:hypothetical protein